MLAQPLQNRCCVACDFAITCPALAAFFCFRPDCFETEVSLIGQTMRNRLPFIGVCRSTMARFCYLHSLISTRGLVQARSGAIVPNIAGHPRRKQSAKKPTRS